VGVTEATSEDTHRIATALRDSGLRALPAPVRIEALTGLARGLLELANHGDVEPLATSGGLSVEMTRWALRTTFERVTPAALAAFLGEAELPGHRMVPAGLAAVLLSGNVLTAPARALLLPLLMGVPVVARVSSREQAFAVLLHDLLSGGCPSMQALASGLVLVAIDPSTSDGAHAFQTLLAVADVVSMYGSDHTCAEVRRQLPPGVQGIEHGHGLGVGVLAVGANADDDAVDLFAAAFALDVAAYDQRGCLSPQVVYVQENGWVSPQRFAERLHHALRQVAVTLPRGPIDHHIGAQQLQYRGVGAALGRLFEGDGWSVTYEGELSARPTPGFRNIAVHSYSEPAALRSKLASLGRHLKVVGYAGEADARKRFASDLPPSVAPRVCPPGEMQTPPFTCVWDGLPAWHGLVRYQAR
jgi:acyl-CoA reductase-like NAD-dependent aldehyde dehydrogenase